MKALLVKRILNISSATKMLKQLNLYAYFFREINAYRKDLSKSKYICFLTKDDKLLKDIIKVRKMLKKLLIKNLIVTVYTMKII